MSDERKLYSVETKDSAGDDWGLIVSATSPDEAVRLWAEHYGQGYYPSPIKVYPLPDPAEHAGALDWGTMPWFEYPLGCGDEDSEDA